MDNHKRRDTHLLVSELRSGWIGVFLLIFTGLIACGRSEPGKQSGISSADSTGNQPVVSGVKIDLQTQKLEGIRVVHPDSGIYQKHLDAYGVVLSPAGLVTLRNKYVEMIQRVRKYKTQLQVTREEYRRQNALYIHNGISQKDYQVARSAWISDQTDLETSQQALRSLIDSSRTYWGPVITGWIQKNNKTIRRTIDQDAWIVRVTPVNSPDDAVRPPQTVSLGNLQRMFTGRFISLSPWLNPRIQKQGYYYLVNHAPVSLSPGMNLRVAFPIGKRGTGVIISDSAVVWTQGEPWFYIRRGPEEFERRPLSSALFQNGKWYLPRASFTSGKLPGVVVSGASILLAQEMRADQPAVSTEEEGDND